MIHKCSWKGKRKAKRIGRFTLLCVFVKTGTWYVIDVINDVKWVLGIYPVFTGEIKGKAADPN